MNGGADYFAADGVNWSTLKYMRESPLAYRHAVSTQRDDTSAFALGRAVHSLVFEPERFADEYAIWTNGDRRGKEWLAFAADNAHRTILKADEHAIAQAAALAVLRDRTASRYLRDGIAERPIFWTDPETGIRCKAKLDYIAGRVLVDLKTTRSVDGRRFGAEAARFAYPQQMAHYEAGCRHGLDIEPEKVLLIAVEKQAPHDVGVFEIDADARQLAAVEVAELLRRLAECRASDAWPGRYTEEQALMLPAWVYADEDEDDANGFGLTFGE